MTGISWVESVRGWSDPEGLKDDAYVLNPFKNRFVRLNLQSIKVS